MKKAKTNGADHSAFKTDQNGKVTSDETFTKPKNPKNPNEYESTRFDGTHTHFDKVTKQELDLHIHDRSAPVGLRSPAPKEIPKGYKK